MVYKNQEKDGVTNEESKEREIGELEFHNLGESQVKGRHYLRQQDESRGNVPINMGKESRTLTTDDYPVVKEEETS